MTKVPANTGKATGNEAGPQPRRGATIALVTVCSLVLGSVAVGTVAGVASSDKETRHAPYLASALPEEGPWAIPLSADVELTGLSQLAHAASSLSPGVRPESLTGPEAAASLDPRALTSTSYSRNLRDSAIELAGAVPAAPAFEIEEFVIEFDVVVRTDSSMAPGAERIVETGAQGVGRVVYRLETDEDGEVKRVEVDRIVDLPAQDRVIARGPRPVAASLPSPTPSATQTPAPKPTTPTPVETTQAPQPSPTPSPSPSPSPQPKPEPTTPPTDEEHLKRAGNTVIGPGGTPASNKALAKSLAQSLYGWGDDEFACLDTLWQKESSWNHRAANPGSTARGIPQALMSAHFQQIDPATSTNVWWRNPAAQTYLNSPETQIRWGLSYIKNGARRGFTTPCEAWEVWQVKGWY